MQSMAYARREVKDGKLLCSSCNEWLALDAFYKSSYSLSGRSSYCKSCERSKAVSFKILEPDKYKAIKDRNRVKRLEYLRNNSLIKLYGITSTEYEALLSSQDGKCAICKMGQCITGRKLSVDHDHDTKKVRGILCANCNRGLGNFKDQLDILIAAAEYLKKHKG